MKRIPFFLLLLIISNTAISQALNWIKQIGNTTASSGGYGINSNSIQTDISGNTYVTGFFTKPADFGGTILTPLNAASTDMFVAKYNSAGNLVWIRSAGAAAGGAAGYAVSLDISGNVIVTGTFDRTANFSGTVLNTARSGIFTARYNNDGDLLWVVDGANGPAISISVGVDVDNAGNVYIIGDLTKGSANSDTTASFSGTLLNVPYRCTFVAKYSSSGSLLWINQIKGIQAGNGIGVLYSRGIAVDDAGNQYITGFFAGTVNFLGVNAATGANTFSDMFLTKYNTNGTVVWVNTGSNTATDGGSYDAVPTGIGLDGLGNVVVAGGIEGPTNFSGTIITTGQPHNPSIRSKDRFLASYNIGGALQWVKNTGVTNAGYYSVSLDRNSLATDASGNIYYHTTLSPYGAVFGSFDFSGTIVTTSTLAVETIISKYDRTGALQFIKQVTGTTGQGYSSRAYGGIAVNGNGAIYAMGVFSGPANFFGTTIQPLAASNYDTYILNLQPSCNGQLVLVNRMSPTSCGGANGSISFTTTNIPNGIYSLTYTGTGSPQNVTVANNSFTLGVLPAGVYSNFYINYNGCTASYIQPDTIPPFSVTATWLGTSTNWNAAGNWSTGIIPDKCTNVIINSGVPNMPVLTGINNFCKSLSVNSPAQVTVGTNAKVFVGN